MFLPPKLSVTSHCVPQLQSVRLHVPQSLFFPYVAQTMWMCDLIILLWIILKTTVWICFNYLISHVLSSDASAQHERSHWPLWVLTDSTVIQLLFLSVTSWSEWSHSPFMCFSSSLAVFHSLMSSRCGSSCGDVHQWGSTLQPRSPRVVCAAGFTLTQLQRHERRRKLVTQSLMWGGLAGRLDQETQEGRDRCLILKHWRTTSERHF